MGCTPRTRQCPTTYLARGEPTPECCREHVTRLLHECTTALDQAGIHYWLDYGALLGAVRDGGMIPWDNDADIGILASDYLKLKALRVTADANDWLLRIVKHADYARAQVSFINKLHVCIFVWHDSKTHPGMLARPTYMRTDAVNNKGKDFPRAWIETRERVQYGSLSLWAPHPPERMLTHRYGDWRAPVKHHAKGAPA
jgi:hypothetical protein